MQVSFVSKAFSPLLLAGVLVLAACDDSSSGGAGGGMGMGNMPPPVVSTVTLEPQRVTLTTELVGRTVAYRQAEVRPQVSGILQQRLFEEGSEVAEGQQLYQIDPATYEAALASAEAELAKAKANLKAVQAKANRYSSLVKNSTVSRQDYDDVMAGLDQAKAGILAAEAAKKTAEINLGYTRVCAPLGGRIGKSAVSEGALVAAGQATTLTTITQLDPIYVDLNQSSEEMARLRRALSDGVVQRDANAPVEVTLVPDGAVSGYTLKGELKFSDVTVDPSTGNVSLRAVFPNPDKTLFPGLFVRAHVATGMKEGALLVPQQAVVRQPDGSALVWVVGADSVVNPAPVVLGQAMGAQWVVKEGLKAGDRVVVEGVHKMQPAMTVQLEGDGGRKE